MSDLDYDPLLKRVHDVLTLLPTAESALSDLSGTEAFQNTRLAQELSRRIAAQRVFADRDLFDVETLLEPVAKILDEEWTQQHVWTEGCVSPGWVSRIRTARGADLATRSKPLFDLFDALRAVQSYREAEKRASAIRERDFS